MADTTKEPVTNELEAGIVKKRFTQKGPYNDMQLSQAMASFSEAVGAASNIINAARSLKTKTSSNPVDKKNNYYLTPQEKSLIQRRAGEFAKPGIVPFDVLEDFLYVLCYVEEYEMLKLAATVTGVVGLDDPNIVRVPLSILNVPELSKIGYLANGLASLTKQLDSQKYTQGQAASSNDNSAYSAISKAASATDAASKIITNFNGMQGIISLVTQTTSVMTAIQSLTSLFSSEGNNANKIATVTNTLQQVTSLVEGMSSTLGQSGKNNIVGTFPLMAQLGQIQGVLLSIETIMDSLENVQTSNTYPKNKVNDMDVSFKNVFDEITNVATSLTTIASALSQLKPPNGGNLGNVARMSTRLLSGGSIPSSFETGKMLGQEIPQNILAKNPLSVGPSYLGKTMFGESLAKALHKRDGAQFPAVPIAVFRSAASGAALPAFRMQNSQSMGGSMDLASAVSSILGTASAAATAMHIDNVSNILGAASTAATELRRSDNAIPIMIALATSFSNDTGNPFPTSVYSEGWKIASAVGNMLQKEGRTVVV